MVTCTHTHSHTHICTALRIVTNVCLICMHISCTHTDEFHTTKCYLCYYIHVCMWTYTQSSYLIATTIDTHATTTFAYVHVHVHMCNHTCTHVHVQTKMVVVRVPHGYALRIWHMCVTPRVHVLCVQNLHIHTYSGHITIIESHRICRTTNTHKLTINNQKKKNFFFFVW